MFEGNTAHVYIIVVKVDVLIKLVIMIIGIAILSISAVYIIQVTQEQQITQILVTNEKKEGCDESIDKNRNGVPDKFENVMNPPRLTHIPDGDYSNCIFPNNLSNIQFSNANFTNADFSNTKLRNIIFNETIFDETNFSNSEIHGVIFINTSINESNFTNTNFIPETWENAYITFTVEDDQYSEYVSYYMPYLLLLIPCLDCPSSEEFELYVNDDQTSLNLRLADKIDDESDRREIYRHVTGFYQVKINESIFKNTDLSHVVFSQSVLSNSVIEFSNTFNILFDNTTLKNTEINDEYYREEIKNEVRYQNENFKQIEYDKINQKNEIKNSKININLIHVMDEIPINWSMGMTTFEENFYVADTDNHKINVYDLNTFEKKFEFKSPLSHYCKSTHTWTETNLDCPNNIRNLPTSIAILNEKIFVAYGFQNEIQVFDINGEFLSKFESSGNQKEEFDRPFKISATDDLLYIADSGNKKIQIMDSEGKFIKDFNIPIPIKLDSNIDLDIFENRVYVIDDRTAGLWIYDLNGKLN